MSIFQAAATALTYLITDGSATATNFKQQSKKIRELVSVAVDARISLIQIREKQLSARFVFELTNGLAEITKNSETRLLVNDRADIAAAAGADGVHSTSTSLPANVIRENFPSLTIGVSTHMLEETVTAADQGADFALFGPIFATTGKGDPVGVEVLRRVCEAADPFPVIAVGGIDESNFESILRAGARGFAAIRFLNEADNFRKLVRLTI